MPDSYGKRQRNAKKARKLAEREERRLARKQQRADDEAGVSPDDSQRPEAADGEAVEGPVEGPAGEPEEAAGAAEPPPEDDS